MKPHPVQTRITGFILEDQTELTLDDVCRACAAQTDMIIQLVDEGVLAPSGTAPGQWRFTGLHMHRAQVALRLQRDLGVNLAGAALALELLDEMQSLRTQLHRLAVDV
ncbi:chaperone modulator CbpM [Polaromonas sp. P1(28)-13]|nr:chaperone modulator CbpM [Polaromonas sp. P1(28)-13]